MPSQQDIDRLKELLKARTEYEISDSSRDGPLAHAKMEAAMTALSDEVLQQATADKSRCDELTAAAQRGIQHLIAAATGASTPQEWSEWLRGRE